MLPRIVITGIGVISSAGVGVEALRRVLQNGQSCVRPIDSFDTHDLSCKIGAVAADFAPHDFLSRREVKCLDRSAQFFVAACQMAMDDGKLLQSNVDRTRVGVFEGTSLGGLYSALQEQEILLSKGFQHVHPQTLNAAMTGAGGSMVSLLNKFHGPVLAFSNGSVSSACAMATAIDQLRLHEIDVAVTGGGEAPINRPLFILFSRAGMLSKRNDKPESACRPFDATRDGVVLGEGAAALVLERLEQAQSRGAKIYGEVLAVALTSDAHSFIAPAPDAVQQARALELAMTKARVSPTQIDYIAAHGTATLLNDRVETLALKKALGEHAHKIPVSAIKSMLGHTLGACSAIEAVAALVAVQQQFVPPTINLNNPDPACDLDYVPHHARMQSIDLAMVKNSSFGGKNSAIILLRWRE